MRGRTNEFIKPSHTYEAIVYDHRNSTAETFSAALNGKRVMRPVGIPTKIPGWAIIVIQEAVVKRPIMSNNKENGMPEIVGYKRSPRYSVEVLSDLTDKKEHHLPRIANESVDLLTVEDKERSLDDMTRDDLREMAKQMGITRATAMSKADLIKNIELMRT